MALNDIMQSIKDFFTRLTRRQKALPEPQMKSEPRPKNVYATNNPSDWRRSLSVDLQPHRSTIKTESSENHRLTGSRQQRESAQRNTQNPDFRRNVATIAIAATLALSGAAIYRHFHPSFKNMDSQQRVQYIYNQEHSEKDLDIISNTLEDTGIELVKRKIGEALGLDESQYDNIVLTASEGGIPARVTGPNNTVYFENNGTLIGEENHNQLSPGIVSVINGIARLQDEENPATREKLANFATQLAILEDNDVYKNPNSERYPGSHRGSTVAPAANIDDLLVIHSIANDGKEIDQNNNEVVNNNQLEDDERE